MNDLIYKVLQKVQRDLLNKKGCYEAEMDRRKGLPPHISEKYNRVLTELNEVKEAVDMRVRELVFTDLTAKDEG